MSRGVSNILVENCIFAGTDIGVRFKSAIGRGGVVEDITIKNITMTDIIEEAFIFTMGYVLVNIEDENEGKVTVLADDVPEFKNIHLENIICDQAKTAIKINGLKELPIHDIDFNNVFVKASKGLDLAMCKDIKFTNTTIITTDEVKRLSNEVISVE